MRTERGEERDRGRYRRRRHVAGKPVAQNADLLNGAADVVLGVGQVGPQARFSDKRAGREPPARCPGLWLTVPSGLWLCVPARSDAAGKFTSV